MRKGGKGGMRKADETTGGGHGAPAPLEEPGRPAPPKTCLLVLNTQNSIRKHAANCGVPLSAVFGG